MSTPIADYAALGDGRTVALVSREGSVDWLCLPDLDSPACFAALLGTPENGRWALGVRGATQVSRRYVGDSFVLETEYRTPTGRARALDWMPTRDGHADLSRKIEVLEGEVTVVHELVVRFDYGAVEPWVTSDGSVLRIVAGPDSLTLRADRLPHQPHALGHRHADVFTLRAGETFSATCTWTPSWEPVPAALPGRSAEATCVDWERWSSRLVVADRHRAPVMRSLLVLRLLTHSLTGGIAAAATTSLPELPGGERNWDYRFCWLRDAALAVTALARAGAVDEARTWRDWLVRALAGRPADMQIMYALDGSRDDKLLERTRDHLPGWEASSPVRTGNGAVGQVQHDALGEVLCALDVAVHAGLPRSATSWAVERALVNDLVHRWRQPDHGIWEVRGPVQHFVQSKVMTWAAFDRAVRAVEEHGQDMTGHEDDVALWRRCRAEVRTEVLTHGWSDDLGSFVQHYGADHVDASLLSILRVGFLPPDDPRAVGTVRRVQRDLSTPSGFVRRYATERTDDGLPGSEATFVACTFWLVEALCAIGETDEAEALFERALEACNDVGLLAEEYDPIARAQLGNTPQALSHLALVGAAQALDAAHEGRAC